MHRVFPPTNNEQNLVDLSHPNNNKKSPWVPKIGKKVWFRNLHESVRYHSLKSSPQKFLKNMVLGRRFTKRPIFRCFFAVRIFVSGTGSYQLKRVSVGVETLTLTLTRGPKFCVAFFFSFFSFEQKLEKSHKRYPTLRVSLPSLKLTFLPLEMDGWKMNFLLGRPIFRGVCCLVSGRVNPKSVFVAHISISAKSLRKMNKQPQNAPKKKE